MSALKQCPLQTRRPATRRCPGDSRSGPPVADAIGGELEIICDGGIRRGSDIVKAVALGATACMAGRAYLYGLGAAGERGVDFVLDHLAAGVGHTMALIGCTSIDELGPQFVART